jgi:hypothetical protein
LKLSDTELIAARAIQLERREEELARIHKRVVQVHFCSIKDFIQRHKNVIHDYDFIPGELVLVLNKKIEEGTNRKCRTHYFGPMVVVERLSSGAYHLAEVNGAISRLKFAAFRLTPYFARSTKSVDVTEYVDSMDLVGIKEV